MKSKPVPTAPEPLEIATAKKLRELVKNWPDTADQGALTDRDHETLALMRETATSLAAAGRSAIFESSARRIASEVRGFASLSDGVERRIVAGVEIDVPAIESKSIQLEIRRRGEAIAEMIDGFIGDRSDAVARKRDQIAADEQDLKVAMRNPTVAMVIGLWELLAMSPRDRTTVSGDLLDSVTKSAEALLDDCLKVTGMKGTTAKTLTTARRRQIEREKRQAAA